MSWSRLALAKKGLFYDEKVQSRDTAAAPYPPHVEALRASMLDFSCAVPGCKDDCGGPGNFRLKPRDNESRSLHIDIAAKRALNEAGHLHQGEFAEIEWANFFQNQFLKPLGHDTSVSEANSRRVSRNNYYYDSFTAGGDALWTEFSGKAHAHDASDLAPYEKEKCPKPDRALYLPMYNLDTDSSIIPRVTDPEARQWHLAPNPSLVESFSWKRLKELFNYGLRPTPFRVFHKPPVQASLNCYPWLIVEHKKEKCQYPNYYDMSEEVMCCQATNAAACAVQLNRNAATYAIKLAEQAHVPPIPTVTTIGSVVKVWIMHYADDLGGSCSDYDMYERAGKNCRQGYIMRAIWEGDMTKLDDIIQFQLILENTHTWAMRVFKPLMASYIDQWKFVHCQAGVADTALLHRQQMIERCRHIIPLIQSYLDKQGGIEIDDTGHSRVTPLLMGLLVQQIFSAERQSLVDDMDRIITKKLEGLAASVSRPVNETQPSVQDERTIPVADTQETGSSLGSKVADDDPNDSDYEESQPTSYTPTTQPDGFCSAPESEFRRTTRSDTLKAAMAQSPTPSLRQSPSIDKTPIRNKNDPGLSTPLSESTTLASSSASTPTGIRSTGRRSVDPAPEDSTTSMTKTGSEPSPGTTTERWPPPGSLFSTKSDSVQNMDLPSPAAAARTTHISSSSSFSAKDSTSSTKSSTCTDYSRSPGFTFSSISRDATVPESNPSPDQVGKETPSLFTPGSLFGSKPTPRPGSSPNKVGEEAQTSPVTSGSLFGSKPTPKSGSSPNNKWEEAKASLLTSGSLFGSKPTPLGSSPSKVGQETPASLFGTRNDTTTPKPITISNKAGKAEPTSLFGIATPKNSPCPDKTEKEASAPPLTYGGLFGGKPTPKSGSNPNEVGKEESTSSFTVNSI
ncbi:hypothetical protein QQS21_000462 [Conoideocrella luteorostrata]|uniref:Uncharacterized protein n=1 Tax=Conoideocrella luteorostrata TaxID=1105319 RepID=A0AAJ0FYI3_9HYPO|nr:hypothetical protein QQS21_000462 [Conoideocrella luteorostrata]